VLYLNAIQSLINRVLWSGWLKNEDPISLLIIAKPESGKSRLLQKFQHNKGVIFITDATAYGVVKGVFPLFETKQPVNHIIIPDLLNPLSKQQATSRAFIQFMNSLIEEGIVEIQTYAIKFRREGIKCGLLSSITKGGFYLNAKKWRTIGFLSRVLPVSYSYTLGASQDILESIVLEDYHKEESVAIDFPDEKQDVKGDSELFRELVPYSVRLGEAEKLYGFRYQKHFQRLAKANALAEGRTVVEKKDIVWVKSVAEWINLEFKVLGEEKNNDTSDFFK